MTAAQNKPECGTLRKYGSFDNQKQKKAFPRVISDPNIGSGTVSRVNNYSTRKVLSLIFRIYFNVYGFKHRKELGIKIR